MNIYAFLSLLASYACFLLGILVYQKDSRNELNRIFTILCMTYGYQALVEFGYRQTNNPATAHVLLRMTFIWPVSIVFLLLFVFVFVKKSELLRSKILYATVYVPALIIAFLDLTTDLITGEPVKMYWGWTYTTPENPFFYLGALIWCYSLIGVSMSLSFLSYFRNEEYIEKQRAKFVFIGLCIPAVVGSFTDGIFPLLKISVPEFSITVLTLAFIFIQYGIWKYKLFVLTPAVAAGDIVAAMSNVLFLVKEDQTISLVNQAAVHLLGYSEDELVGKPLKSIFAERKWNNILQGKDVRDFIVNEETTLMTKDGRIIPVLLSISVIRDKDGNERGFVCVGSDLSDHKRAEEAWKKEVLLREIHHRVKNNMQVISSLLSLQSSYVKDNQYKEMFKESQNRIKTMALIHEKLYQSHDLEKIDFKEYVIDMVQGLSRAYGVPGDIVVRVEMDTFYLGIDTAIPCGLIINELVTNSLKHAFPGKKGEVTVSLRSEDGIIELTVRDNGVGLPENVDFENTQTLGLRLVTMLAKDQLDGEIRVDRRKGTEFCITFREMKK